jgi:hypothetical protein
MRRAVLESLVHARGRSAFGVPLAQLPILRAGLLEMLLDAEAAVSVVLTAGTALDRADGGSADDRLLVRILTPLAKYWITSRARVVVAEAMNVRGGNGYIEEWVNPRLLRDSHLGAIWEGAANVVALDVQRAIVRDGGLTAIEALVAARLASGSAAPAVADRVRSRLAELRARTAAWPSSARDARELEARPVADALYHVLATSLLLGEGQALLARDGSARKLLAAALYARRWLASHPIGAPVFCTRAIGWLDALADFDPVPPSALTDAEP